MSFETEFLQCALSKRFHFVQNSKQMSCGHSFCDGCLKKGSAVGMKCEICQKLNAIDSAKLGESPIAKMFIKMNISEICFAAEKEFEKAFETVKGKILILSFKNYS
jgi:hypothetical protein